MTNKTAQAAPAAPVPYGKMSQCERTRNHSLSNLAFFVAVLLWIVFGIRWHLVDQRYKSQQGAQEALTAAVMAVKQAIVVCNDQGIITLASPDAEKLFGRVLVGRHIHEGMPEVAREHADSAFEKVVNDARTSQKPAVLTLDHVVTDITKEHEFTLMLRVVPENRNHVTVVATFTPRAYIKEVPGVMTQKH